MLLLLLTSVCLSKGRFSLAFFSYFRWILAHTNEPKKWTHLFRKKEENWIYLLKHDTEWIFVDFLLLSLPSFLLSLDTKLILSIFLQDFFSLSRFWRARMITVDAFARRTRTLTDIFRQWNLLFLSGKARESTRVLSRCLRVWNVQR